MSGSLPIRAALAALALLVVIWSVVLLRNDVLARDEVKRIHANPDMGDAGWARAEDRLHDARLLDPSTDLRVDLAFYLLIRRKAEATRVAESVVRDEPDNLEAWVALLKANRGRDARRYARALDEIERLDPKLAAQLR